MKKKKAPKWLRWLYLAMVFLIPLGAWIDFRDYQRYSSYGIFSPEEWIEVLDGFHFRWAIQAIMVACFLYLFAVVTWDKNNDKDFRLLDAAFSTAILLIWAVLPLLISIPDSVWGIWAIVLVAFLVVIGRCWVKYFENKRLEEETYE